MSMFSPCLVLFDYEPEVEKAPEPVKPRRRIGQYQIEMPRATALRFFKLKTEWRVK